MTELTQDQEQAKDALLAFLSSDNDEKCFVLSGSAGTGKTFLIQYVNDAYCNLAELLKATGNYEEMYWEYTATTHKASHALALAANVRTSTIHSLLALRLDSNYVTGSRNLTGSGKTVRNKVLVIDEANFIDYSLLTTILDSTENCKIIFMGDPVQLTPVGLNHSPAFLQKFPTYHLSQIVRQESTHPLTPILQKFRDYLLNIGTPFPLISTSKEIKRVSADEFNRLIFESVSDNWHTSMSKIICWRNKTVSKYNTNIFQMLANRTTFDIGDLVVNNHAIKDLKTDAEVEIRDVVPAKSAGVDGHKYLIDTGLRALYVFTPNKPTDFVRAKNKAVKEADTATVRTIMETWADLRPAYASTVNKAQGCTFDTVFIDLNDFRGVREQRQLARLLYVALSRAKHNVVFTGDLNVN